jgi:hypothetical protein
MQWFRRAIHAMASSFIIFYILEDSDLWYVLKRVVAIAILLLVILWGFQRRTEEDRIHGLLREHETEKAPSFIWFGLGAAILILFSGSFEIDDAIFNASVIGASCIFSAALVDPIMGEIRQKAGRAWSFLIGFLLASFIFYLFGMGEFSFLGGFTLALFEILRIKVDDDLTTQICPAAVFFALGFMGHLPPQLPFDTISLPEVLGSLSFPLLLAPFSLGKIELPREEKFILGATLSVPLIAAVLLVIANGWELAVLMLAIQIPLDALAMMEIRSSR